MLGRLLPARPPALLTGVLLAAALIVVETLLLYPLGEIADPVSLGVIYLLGVLLISTLWGAALGIATSVASALAFNFFHIPPTGRFTIADGENLVALVVFLVAAGVASSLAEAARRRAADAVRAEREAGLAAELARVLLGAPDLSAALGPAAQRIAQVYELASCRLVLDDVGADERSAAIPLDARRRAARDAARPARGRAGGRGRAAGAGGAPGRRPRARHAHARGRRDARAAALGRDQDRRAARGLARPALAADGDGDLGRGARLARRSTSGSGGSWRRG